MWLISPPFLRQARAIRHVSSHYEAVKSICVSFDNKIYEVTLIWHEKLQMSKQLFFLNLQRSLQYLIGSTWNIYIGVGEKEIYLMIYKERENNYL